MVKNAIFTSVWDGGYEITSKCKVNTDTKEVFDIKMVNVTDLDLEILDEEYIILNGVKHSVSNDGDTEYFYS